MAALILQLGLLLDSSAEQVDALLVDALRRQVGGLQLQRGPRFKYVIRASAEELKVKSCGSRHRRRAWGVTTRPPPGPRRICATSSCSSRRTASRKTARLTPSSSISPGSVPMTCPTGKPLAAIIIWRRRATDPASFPPSLGPLACAGSVTAPDLFPTLSGTNLAYRTALSRPEDERVWDGRLQLLATVTGHGSQPSGYPLGVPEICRLVIVAFVPGSARITHTWNPRRITPSRGAFASPIR